MSFANPDDVDEEPQADADEADAETTDSAVETVELEWAAESEAVPDGELPLAEAIKANGEMLRGMPDEFAFENVKDEVEALRVEIADLREERDALRADVDELANTVETLREQLNSLEGWRGNTVATVNQNISELNRLLAAVFDEEPPCPDCEDGHIEANVGGFSDDTVACSDCEYEEQLR